jgi:hypothetical protein
MRPGRDHPCRAILLPRHGVEAALRQCVGVADEGTTRRSVDRLDCLRKLDAEARHSRIARRLGSKRGRLRRPERRDPGERRRRGYPHGDLAIGARRKHAGDRGIFRVDRVIVGSADHGDAHAIARIGGAIGQHRRRQETPGARGVADIRRDRPAIMGIPYSEKCRRASRRKPAECIIDLRGGIRPDGADPGPPLRGGAIGDGGIRGRAMPLTQLSQLDLRICDFRCFAEAKAESLQGVGYRKSL